MPKKSQYKKVVTELHSISEAKTLLNESVETLKVFVEDLVEKDTGERYDADEVFGYKPTEGSTGPSRKVNDD